MSEQSVIRGAGRELDALIAERVMGWNEVPGRGYGGHSWWWNKDGPTHATHGAAWDGGWCPSTDISDAWEVVEKLQGGKGTYFEISWVNYGKPQWQVAIRTDRFGTWTREGGEQDGYLGEAQGETAPLAICRAALAAVGGELPKQEPT